MKVIVTGGKGFIGTNLIETLLNRDHQVLNIDSNSYAANNKEFANENYKFVKGDLAEIDIFRILQDFEPYGVIHCAAESHVDNSINDPDPFINSNIIGTFRLLEAIRKYDSNLRILHMSTDEVYGSLGFDDEPFTEESSYNPSSPYSATKASSDLLVKSWHRTYKLNSVITNCSNNFGEWQHNEKMIPKTIQSLKNSQKIRIYGDGNNVRDWIYVKDHCDYVYKIFFSHFKNETFNIGGNKELSNNELVKKVIKIYNSITNSDLAFNECVEYIEDRKGHDVRYAISMEKTQGQFGNLLGNFDDNLKETISWHLSKK